MCLLTCWMLHLFVNKLVLSLLFNDSYCWTLCFLIPHWLLMLQVPFKALRPSAIIDTRINVDNEFIKDSCVPVLLGKGLSEDNSEHLANKNSDSIIETRDIEQINVNSESLNEEIATDKPLDEDIVTEELLDEEISNDPQNRRADY